MKDNNQQSNKNSNAKRIGIVGYPPILFWKNYKEDLCFDYKVTTLIMISLAVGVAAIFTWCFLGLVSIITSIIALKKIHTNKRNGIVKLLAITGLSLGTINFVYYVITTVYFIIIQ